MHEEVLKIRKKVKIVNTEMMLLMFVFLVLFGGVEISAFQSGILSDHCFWNIVFEIGVRDILLFATITIVMNVFCLLIWNKKVPVRFYLHFFCTCHVFILIYVVCTKHCATTIIYTILATIVSFVFFCVLALLTYKILRNLNNMQIAVIESERVWQLVNAYETRIEEYNRIAREYNEMNTEISYIGSILFQNFNKKLAGVGYVMKYRVPVYATTNITLFGCKFMSKYISAINKYKKNNEKIENVILKQKELIENVLLVKKPLVIETMRVINKIGIIPGDNKLDETFIDVAKQGYFILVKETSQEQKIKKVKEIQKYG